MEERKDMQLKPICSYDTFITALKEVGFSLAGENDEAIFSLSSFFTEDIHWHTDDKETDPWEWRMKSILERNDILYGKVFLNKGGYITKEWFTYFYVLRRQGKTFEDIYSSGEISYIAKQIYDIIEKQSNISLHEIKVMLGATKENKSQIDRAITLLQMKLLITISGQTYKTNVHGQPYGWPVTTFATVDEFVGDEVLFASQKINSEEAFNKIRDRILQLNPEAPNKKIQKFIYG